MDSQNRFLDIDDDELEILESRTPASSTAPSNINMDRQGQGSSNNSKKQKPPKRQRATMSDVWKYFNTPSNGKTTCIGCGKEYSWIDSTYGTSTLSRHAEGCPKTSKYKDVKSMIMDHEGKLRSTKLEPKKVRDLISMAIVSHDLPLSFVEYKWIRALLSYLNSDCKHISRLTATNDIMKMYCAEKEKLKRVMIGSPGRICLTSDCWTACTSEGYICITAHFVDCDWKLHSKILSFCKMEPPHSGWELANKVYDSLKEWGIEKKIFSLTLDNASANDCMQDILRDKLSFHESLLCNGKFFHVRCCAHILNIIVQEGLKVANEAVKKISESIKYVKASEGRMKVFLECVSQVGGIDTKMGLRLDASTRWNSTYTMLESALKYQRAFNSLQLVDRNYKFAPTNEEWKKGEKMCEFLNPFNEMTNLISGSSYPTSNMYFMQVWKIECFLKAHVDCEDEEIKNMAKQMIVKFDKYWTDYSFVLAFGAVFDPRAKLGMLKFCYFDLDPRTCNEKVHRIRSNLQMLFGDYLKLVGSTQSSARFSEGNSASSSLATPPPVKSGTGYKAVVPWQSAPDLRNEKSELEQYLDEPALDLDYYADLDVLEYWKNNKKRFPVLTVMACDILSIPITTVASESAFSIGARVLNKYRSRLVGDHVQAIICTRSWLQGFADDEDDLKQDTDTFSNQGSISNVDVVED